MHRIWITLLLTAVGGCANTAYPPAPAQTAAAASASPARLTAVLDAQPDEAKARYEYRHPQETLEFLGIAPGMTVVEALPGGGWYSKILLDYLGSDGHLIGADYALEMFPLFGFFSDEFIAGKKSWVTDWTRDAEGWRGPQSAPVSAFVFGSMPDRYAGKADAVLFIRALHNLNRFESQGGFMTQALADAHKALKPGGLLGVVQHQAPAGMPEGWADGSKGYLEKKALIARLQAAGFQYLGESPINQNPKDRPGEADVVWRLPPTLFTSRDNPELRQQMLAVGESNRMTLKFRKR